MKEADKWTSTSTNSVNRLEKCSIIDVDQIKNIRSMLTIDNDVDQLKSLGFPFLQVDVDSCLFLGRWQAALFITPKKLKFLFISFPF